MRSFLIFFVFSLSLIGSSLYLAAEERSGLPASISLPQRGIFFDRSELLPIKFMPISAEAFMIASISGSILAEKNPEIKLPVASLTKVMTALILAEQGRGASVTLSERAAGIEPRVSGLPPGASASAEAARTLLLVESNNDWAEAIAEAVGRVIDPQAASAREVFINAMNRKAQLLSMGSTRFDNPSGLDGELHYSTAEDMLRLARYISKKHPDFWSVTSSPPAKVELLSGKEYRLKSSNLLMDYPGLIGVKTGLTDEAKGALLLRYRIAEYPEDLFIVLLRSEDRFRDGERLMQGVRGHFKSRLNNL